MKVLKILLAVVLAVVVLAGGFFGWAKSKTASLMTLTTDTHRVEVPVPFPLSEAEIAELRAQKAAASGPAPAADPAAAEAEAAAADPAAAPLDAAAALAEPPPDPLAGVDLAAVAQERAVARGKHLVEGRYACVECHGRDFGGGVMIDDPAIGTFLGPNITLGTGSRTLAYTTADWDRIVRHGVKPDGTRALMPSEDFLLMSDRELSDIIAYVRTFPPVDKEVASVSFGPVGTILMAKGKWPRSAERIPDHQGAHAVEPPETAVTVEFGRHLAGICTGCHRAELNGGPMPFGPPDWAPARNLTPSPDGLAGWTFEQFEKAMISSIRPDGTGLRMPMTLVAPYAAAMTDTERRALFTYLQSLPATATGT